MIDEEVKQELDNLTKQISEFVKSEIKKAWKILPQAETQFGMHLALCVDTIDPLKQNRVRFFSPTLHHMETPIKALPFASPISSMGGFDACGLNWVPPAGSLLAIVFENGNRSSPFYLGTVWNRDRGPDGKHLWDYPVDEYYKIHEGHRKGYLVGDNTGAQVFPQWNTENYNGFDIDSVAEFEEDEEAQKKITYPNIYGFATPQKNMWKNVDGNYKCNHKGKRMEFLSSCGQHFIMKDDHIHNSGHFTHPSCGNSGPDATDCADEDGNPKEKLDCEGNKSNSSIQHGHPSTPDGTTYGLDSNKGSNLYFKHANECRPYKGPGTPQNNKVMLPQSGMQWTTLSGHTFGADDSVEEPRGVPEWERSLEDFDFGCNDKFLGRMFFISATGHKIILSDQEEETELRGKDNYIRMLSALGNKIELNDHTKEKNSCIAGENRGILMQSTSNHTVFLCDNENEVECPVRKEGGTPTARAKRAFVRIRSGYGLSIHLNDYEGGDEGESGSQEETINQNIQIFCPQKDNEERGPHIMRFQERPEGPGQVYLQAGGDYICFTYDRHTTIVGKFSDEETGDAGNPSDKIVAVSKDYIEFTEGKYINIADLHYFRAEQQILLMAGKDCPPNPGEVGAECGPCIGPVLVYTPRGIVLSDRVYASASLEAPCASIFQMKPFVACGPQAPCGGGVVTE